jgi:polyhydroxyalkanoate synthesis repressor PhaR
MRTIKRYSNRKLYDTQDKKYITLEQIAALVRDGEDLQVIDNQSGKDLTKVTLSQILLEEEKRQETPLSKAFFMNLVQRSSNSASSMVDSIRRNISTWFDATFISEENVENVEDKVDRLVEGGEMSKEEGRRVKDEIQSRMLAFRRRMDELIEHRVQDFFARLNIPTKAEVVALERRLEAVVGRFERVIAELAEERAARAEPAKPAPQAPPPGPGAEA